MKRPRSVLLVFGLLLCAALVAPSAAAKGPGGNKPPTELSNNLSVPTIMIGGAFTGVTCPADAPGALVAPTGTPLTGYAIDPAAYYYVQRVSSWQAQCYTSTAAEADAAWGDNLTGDASLKVGSPIRVELGLFESTGITMDGYTVLKLEPDMLDRESPYGTLATGSVESGFAATPTTFTSVRVYVAGVTFSILGPNGYVVPLGTGASAEINATGAVVYGYNLRVTEPGTYTITYWVPNVTLTGVDAGTFDAIAHTVSLSITVAGGGGGGGGGGGWGQH